MASRALPIEITNILEKLEFIARIPSNHKANIPDKTLQHKDSWWGAFSRGRKNVDRKSTLRDIQTIIDETSTALNTFDDNENYVKLIINALKRARQPIQEMGESTYGDDVSVGSEISVKLQTIDLFLKRYKNYLDSIDNHHNSKYKNSRSSPPILSNNSNRDRKRKLASVNSNSSESNELNNIIADLELSFEEKSSDDHNK